MFPLFVCVQPGFESALEEEISARFPGSILAESLPGWRVFSRSETYALADLQDAPSIYAKSWGWLLGRTSSPWMDPRLRDLFEHGFVFQCWARQEFLPGARQTRPIPIEVELREKAMREELSASSLNPVSDRNPSQPGQTVLSYIRVSPKDWAWGYHEHSPDRIAFPGGEYPWPEAEVPSRAYVKCREALTWSGLPIRAGDSALELGCAPGGSTLALLEQGLLLTTVDPAELVPSVFEAARTRGLPLTHRKCLAEALRIEDLPSRVDWVFSDMNVPPAQLLGLLKGWMPSLRERGLRGMLLTLKLTRPGDHTEIPSIPSMIREEWGLARVRLRQLSQNRRELFLYAIVD